MDLYNGGVPPRYAYWTILIDNKPTAFRSRDAEELLPTLNQLRRKNSDVVMKWFARGRLWDTPEQAQWAGKNLKGSEEKRGKDWRPGGEHKDPRARFDKRKKEKPAAAAQFVRPAYKKAFRPADSQRQDRPWRDKKPGRAQDQRPWRHTGPTGGRSWRDNTAPGAAKSGPPWRRKAPSGAAKGGPPWGGKPPSGAGEGGRRRNWRDNQSPRRPPGAGDNPAPGAGKGGRPGREPRAGDNPAPGAAQGRPGRSAPLSGGAYEGGGGPTAHANQPPVRPPGAGNTASPDAGIAHRPNAQESPKVEKGEERQIEPKRTT